MQINKIQYYTQKIDERGGFYGILNSGNWREVNYFRTRAGAVRGNHFSKETTEVVFLLKGEVNVELIDVNNPNDRASFVLRAGEGIEVKPYVFRRFQYVADSETIALLDRPFDPLHPDLHNLEE